MSVIDSYRRGWALRQLREAKAELTAAQLNRDMARELIFNATRKAQSAIYHSLGNPASITTIVQQNISEENLTEDPILKSLVEIEKSVQWIASLPSSSKNAMTVAENIIQVASEIVKLFTNEPDD
ncbi:MAG: hypothetical protein OEZ48_03855 [Candidatus Bathyarchaeota archaeon]|nr:hypothetical protein [Candidatus Bathyarchaeota archaeon]